MAIAPDEEWLICIPVYPGVLVVKGSHTRKCARCERSVWVAPSGLELIRERPQVRIACMGCAPALSADYAERFPGEEQHAIPMPLTPAQRAELAEEFERRGMEW